MSDPQQIIPSFNEVMHKDTQNGKVPSFADIMGDGEPIKKKDTFSSDSYLGYNPAGMEVSPTQSNGNGLPLGRGNGKDDVKRGEFTTGEVFTDATRGGEPYQKQGGVKVYPLLKTTPSELEERLVLHNAITQVPFKKNERPFDQTEDEAIAQSTKRLNDIMFGEGTEWKDPISAAVKGMQKSKTTKEAVEHLGVKTLTEMSLASDGFEAKRTLANTIWGKFGNDNLTSQMLRGKAAEYDKAVQPLKDLTFENYGEQVTNPTNDYTYKDKIYSAAVKAFAEKHPQFKKDLDATGVDPNDWINLRNKLDSYKLGEAMNEYLQDPNVKAFVSKENPDFAPALGQIGNDLLKDNEKFGINAVANKVSRAVQETGYNKIDPIFNFYGKGHKEMADLMAREVLSPDELDIWDKHIKDNQEQYMDAPSFFEGFGTQAKDILKSTRQTFTSWFTPTSESVRNKWDKEANTVSANPQGFSKWLRDFGGVSGLISTIGATGNITGIANPAMAGAAATLINFWGGEMENKKAEYPDRPVTAIVLAAINTSLYAALSADIFPGAKIKSAFDAVQPEIKNVVEKFTSGKINLEATRQQLNTAVKKATDFVTGTASTTAKVSLELTGITGVNRVLDKIAGMPDDRFKELHPDDELPATLVHTFTTFAPISGIGKFGEMRQRNRVVEETIYDAVSNPLRTQRALDMASINLSFGAMNEIKENFNLALQTKKELDQLKIHPKDQKRFIFEALKEKASKDQAEASQDPVIQKQAKEKIKESQEIKEKILAGEDSDKIVTTAEQEKIDEQKGNEIKLQRLQEDNDLQNKKFDKQREGLDGINSDDKIKIEEIELNRKRANEDFEEDSAKLKPKEQPADQVAATGGENISGVSEKVSAADVKYWLDAADTEYGDSVKDKILFLKSMLEGDIKHSGGDRGRKSKAAIQKAIDTLNDEMISDEKEQAKGRFDDFVNSVSENNPGLHKKLLENPTAALNELIDHHKNQMKGADANTKAFSQKAINKFEALKKDYQTSTQSKAAEQPKAGSGGVVDVKNVFEYIEKDLGFKEIDEPNFQGFAYEKDGVKIGIMDKTLGQQEGGTVQIYGLRGKKAFTISEIVVDESMRGEGKAAEVIKAVLDFADKNGDTVYVEPNSSLVKKLKISEGLSTNQLKEWYGKYGFKEVSKDVMIREPQSLPTQPEAKKEVVGSGVGGDVVWEKKGIKGHTESADIGGYSVDISRRFDYLNKVVGADLTIKKKNSDGTFTVKKVISDYKTFNEAKKDAINRVNEINGVGIETLKVKKNEPNNVVLKDKYKNSADTEFEHGFTFIGELGNKEKVDQSKPFAVGYFGDNAANRYEHATASNDISDVVRKMKDFDSNEGVVEIYNPKTKEKNSFTIYPLNNEYTNESVGLKAVEKSLPPQAEAAADNTVVGKGGLGSDVGWVDKNPNIALNMEFLGKVKGEKIGSALIKKDDGYYYHVGGKEVKIPNQVKAEKAFNESKQSEKDANEKISTSDEKGAVKEIKTSTAAPAKSIITSGVEPKVEQDRADYEQQLIDNGFEKTKDVGVSKDYSVYKKELSKEKDKLESDETQRLTHRVELIGTGKDFEAEESFYTVYNQSGIGAGKDKRIYRYEDHKELQKSPKNEITNTPDTKGNEPVAPKEESGVVEDVKTEGEGTGNPPPDKPKAEPGGEDNTVGVRHESLKKIADKMGLKQPERGTFLSPEEQTERGRKLLEGGADPEAVAQEFKDEGKVSADMISVARAHWMNLVKDAQDALDANGKESKEFKAALDKMQKWQDDVLKPMGTASGGAFSALQGEVDIDTGSFVAVSNAFKNETGNEPNKQQEAKIKELTEQNQKLKQQADELEAKVIEITDKLLNAEKGKPTSIKDKTKKAADVIRKLKAHRPDTFSAATPASLVWDAAVEIVAKTVEVGGSIIDAVAKGVEHIRNSDWHKGLNNEQKEKAEQDFGDALLKPDEKELEAMQKIFVDKKGNKFTPDEAKSIWNYGKKNYLDKGFAYRDMIGHVSDDLGLTWRQISEAIISPKAKRITDALWKKQADYRRNQIVTKNWIDIHNRSPLVRAWKKLSGGFRGVAVFGHGGIFMGTHAGMTLFQPTTWKYTVPAFFRGWKFAYGNTAVYERAMGDLTHSPNYVIAQRTGLKNNPEVTNAEEYTNSQKYLGRLGMAGVRGFGAVKVLRQHLFDYHYDKLSAAEKADVEAVTQISRLVNNATGATNLKLPEWVNEVSFAGGMESARWGKLTRNPARATSIALKALFTPEKATTAERVFAKVWASRVGQQLATFAGLLAANAAAQALLNPKNPVNLTNPDKSDFLKFKFGDVTIDPTSGMLSTAKFSYGMVHDATVNQKKLGGDKRIEAMAKRTFGQARGKAAPLYSTLIDVGTQTDYYGNPMPFSNDKARAGKHTLSWGEYLWQKAPLPVAEAAHVTEQSAYDNGATKLQFRDIVKGIMLGAFSGSTGFRVGESPKDRPSPFTEEDKKDPTFKYFSKDWGMELPNTVPTSEEITDEEKGTKKKLSEYPQDVQDKYMEQHKAALKEELQGIKENKTIYVKKYKDAQGNPKNEVYLNEPSGDYDEKPLGELSTEEKAQVLRLAQSQATSKTKKAIFNQ